MTNDQPVISLHDVNKVFENGTIALENLNLTVNRSEFISFVGPSGCGKSTLLRIIAGLSNVSSGTLDWYDLSDRQNLAFVFQEPALMPWSTVRDNVKLPLRLAKIPQKEAEKTVDRTLQLVGLENFKRAYPRQLSGGMKMRGSIARALSTNPTMLLLDEPFGALDDITRNKLNDDLLELWSQQRWTVLFVTHNIYEAVYLSTRVIIMAARPGRAIADIKIDVPSPRTEEFRRSFVYSEYCQQVADALSKAMSS
ncbi:MAG: ABC transporter ATP-binding protein [Cyanobacteria bacterium J055]|nr:MAG: ABC transporter ATP-binding protein [Cyanobacteria bacterium J055]